MRILTAALLFFEFCCYFSYWPVLGLLVNFSHNKSMIPVMWMGMMYEFVAFPVGMTSSAILDKCGRTHGLWFARANGLIMTVALFVAATLPETMEAPLFATGAVGLYWGIMGPTYQAIVSDNLAQEDVTTFFTRMFIACYSIAPAIGRLLLFVVFSSSGNSWDTNTMKYILYGIFAMDGLLVCAGFFVRSSTTKSAAPVDLSVVAHAEDAHDCNNERPSSQEEASSCCTLLTAALALLCVSLGLNEFLRGAFLNYFSFYAANILHTSPSIWFGTELALYGTSLVVSTIMNILQGRWNPYYLVCIVCVGHTVSLAVLYVLSLDLDNGVAAILVLYVAASCLRETLNAMLRGTLMKLVPEKSKGRWIAIGVEGASQAGRVSSILITGLVADSYTLQMMFLPLACVSACTLVIVVAVTRMSREFSGDCVVAAKQITSPVADGPLDTPNPLDP